ncbi:hypothetical protein BDZ89DRAFT_422613 [Hymenopellis radicata]|nr:hypothetical protein BDZ89DRAFT_422613 [Hymenopellis radicata]
MIARGSKFVQVVYFCLRHLYLAAYLSLSIMFALNSLPPELLTECLSYLDPRSLTICRLICKALRNAVDTSVLLKYKLALYFDNATDTYESKETTSERYKRLIASREAWGSLEWEKETSTPARGDCSAYEVVSGKFVKMLWGRELFVLTLPTVDSEAHLEIHPDRLTGLIKDFAMDPSQDVVAYLEDDASTPSFTQARTMTMHLRSLSDFRAHSEASCPRLLFEIAPITLNLRTRAPNVLGVVTMQMVGDVLALFIQYVRRPSRLIVWNWKTGELLTDDSGPLVATSCHFGCIDAQTFILTKIADVGSVHIVKIIAGRVRSGIAFHLPPIKVTAECITTHSSALPSKPAGISANQERRIHAFTIDYGSDDEGHLDSYCLFVHNDYLLRMIHLYPPNADDLPKRMVWSEWGLHNTRLLPLAGTFYWMRYVFGQKVVCPAIEGATELEVLDFNVHPSKLLPDTPVRTARGDSIVENDGVFESPVRTKLPFYSLKRCMPKTYTGYMIDEQRIVGLKLIMYQSTENAGDDLELDTIDVFCFPV